jgi:hypothetical protein
MSTIAKTSNAAWKEYKAGGGTIVKFTDWLHREKEKMFSANGEDDSLLLVNRSLNDSVQGAIKDTLKTGGLKEKTSGKTLFGINTKWLIGSAIVLTGGIIYLIVKRNKN